MVRRLICALLFYVLPHFAIASSTGSIYGPLQVQNDLSEIAANGYLAQAAARNNLQLPVAIITTSAALSSFPTTGLTNGTIIDKIGYYTNGDMPPVEYSFSTSACSLNVGAGDLGGQFPGLGGNTCWNIVPQTSYDVRWWGAIQGGTDPYYTSGDTGNALSFNNMFNFGQLITANTNSNKPYGGPDLTGAGLNYGVNYPVDDVAASSYTHDIALTPLSTTNFPCNSANGGSTAVFEVTGTSQNRYTSRITVDDNFLPVNAVGFGSNGHGKTTFITTRHWAGSCGSFTSGAVATETAGSNLISMSSTTGVYSGMVLRGDTAYGVPDRSVVLKIYGGQILISKAATGSYGPNPLTFYTDPNGIVFGLGNTNTGDEYYGLNSVEYDHGDTSYINVPDDRYGFAFDFTGDANDILVLDCQGSQGVENFFIDNGTGGIKLNYCEFANANWTTTFTGSITGTTLTATSPNGMLLATAGITGTGVANNTVIGTQISGTPEGAGTYNVSPSQTVASTTMTTTSNTEAQPSTVLITPNPGNISMIGDSFNAPVSAFFDSNSTPTLTAATIQYTASSQEILNPSAVFQLYNKTSNTDFSRVGLDATSSQYQPTSYSFFSIYGPGTVAELPNSTIIGGPLINFYLGQKSYNASTNLGAADCSYVINVTGGTTPVNLTLPDTLTGLGGGTAESCVYWIYAQGSAVTLSNYANGQINGQTISSSSPIPLSNYTMYTAIITGGGSYLSWSLTPVPAPSGVPVTLSNTTGQILYGGPLASKLIYRTSCAAAVTDTTTSATAILNQMQFQYPTYSEIVRIKNLCSYPETIAGGTGVVLNPGDTFITASGSWRDFDIVVNSVASPAVTIYSAGGGTN